MKERETQSSESRGMRAHIGRVQYPPLFLIFFAHINHHIPERDGDPLIRRGVATPSGR